MMQQDDSMVTVRGFVNLEGEATAPQILLITEDLEEFILENNEKAQELLDQIDMDIEAKGYLTTTDSGHKKLTMLDYKIIDHSS
jgi:hypothetical protein